MTAPEPSCTTVLVDGEPVRVLGDPQMSPEALDAFQEVVRAARKRMEAEPPPTPEQLARRERASARVREIRRQAEEASGE